MKNNFKGLKFPRFSVMGALLLACVGLEYYFHIVRGITVVYTHLFYIPLIVAALWWGLKGGLCISLLLGLIHIVFELPGLSWVVFSRALMFIFIGIVIGIISDGKKRLDGELKKQTEQLEHRVKEQTVELGDRTLELETANGELNREIVDHKRTEEALHRVNRALRALSECNQTVIRATEESDLLNGVCRIIVEVGGYRMAWIGLAEHDEEKSVHPVAQAGYDQGYLDTINITWADTERGRGPTGRAIRSGTPVVARHILTNPDFEPWRASALKHGYASSIALPLIANGQTLGAINTYASEPDTFDAEEVKLLNELAENLAFGIITLRTHVSRLQAEKELAKYRDHLEELVKEQTTQLNEKAEELEQANIRLHELDRLKSMFIASMSHELRTPLNSIIGFTGIILQGMTGEITEEQRKQLTMVKNSAGHLLALINDIIDVSKIEAGKEELAIREFDLTALTQEVKDSFTVTAQKKGLKMSIKTPSVLTIESDKRRTKQVIANLVGNAVKFTDKGEIEINVMKKAGVAEVSVMDTGVGIRKEAMDKLFKAFSQILAEGRLNEEGTGLGLYLSRKISSCLGGEITVESEFGKGSKFIFTLPLYYKGAQHEKNSDC